MGSGSWYPKCILSAPNIACHYMLHGVGHNESTKERRSVTGCIELYHEAPRTSKSLRSSQGDW